MEAQHRVSTMKLTDSLREQEILEDLIDATKPPVPAGCARLNFLLMTPFRYSASNPWGSRFRRAHSPDGVFYASEHPRTAIAETAFHRLRFFAESPQTPWPKNPGEYTAFAAGYRSAHAFDISVDRVKQAAAILDPVSYEAGQAFSDTAREAGIEIIRYPSVRDPNRSPNLALLSPAVFTHPDPMEQQSWRLHLDANGARAICEAPRLSVAFGRDAFNNDPRMPDFIWER